MDTRIPTAEVTAAMSVEEIKERRHQDILQTEGPPLTPEEEAELDAKEEREYAAKQAAEKLFHGECLPRELSSEMWMSNEFNAAWAFLSVDPLIDVTRTAKALMAPGNNDERRKIGADMVLRTEAIRVQQAQIANK